MTVALREFNNPDRNFLPPGLEIEGWESLSPFLRELLSADLASASGLVEWLKKLSEVEAALYEDLAWRYIRMTCNTADPGFRASYNDFVENVLSKFKTEENLIRKKLIASPFLNELKASEYQILIRSFKNSLELFRENNIPLLSKVQTLAQKYGEITGVLEIEHEGEHFTLPKAASLLENQDRNLREIIWKKISDRRLIERENLDTLFDELITIRQQIAKNAACDSFVDYCFKELGRFDYTEADCMRFHEAVEKEIKPIYQRFQKQRLEKLGIDKLRPWDLSVDIFGDQPLVPFSNATELISKSIKIFNALDPEFGNLVSSLNDNGLLDLESRKGKAPGGYNYPLPETGLSFIFMNSVGTVGDLITMVHEAGHALHAGAMQKLELNEFRNVPSEIAELASMSMELLTMDLWNEFFPNPEELKRAKFEELSRTINILPWVATIDCFQLWVYRNPKHTSTQRSEEWVRIFKRFHGDIVDWSGYEPELGGLWQKQIHIFEVPFYYIEYGMAQLGAIAIWRNYKMNPAATIANYKKFLSLGYTKTIPELYAAAGITFGFSHEYISELAEFMVGELDRL